MRGVGGRAESHRVKGTENQLLGGLESPWGAHGTPVTAGGEPGGCQSLEEAGAASG